MSTYSRLCSDEELQKARADLREIMARRGAVVAGERKAPGHGEDDGGSNEDGKKKKKKKKKKKMYVMPQERVERILNMRCGPLYEGDAIHKAAREDERYGDISTLVTVAHVLTKNCHDIVRAAQEKLRREIETKGYYAYEATDDDEAEEEEEDESAVTAPGGKGRRRHRSGMVKHAKLSL